MSSYKVEILDSSSLSLEITSTIGDKQTTAQIVPNNISNIVVSDNILELSTSLVEIDNSANNQQSVVQVIPENISNISVSHDIALLPSDFHSNVKNIIGSYLNAGSGIVLYNQDSKLFIGTSGLYSSGNYSLVGHNHYVSDIVDFNTGVSGLLPLFNISAGSGISVDKNNKNFTIAVTGQFGLTSPQVDTRIVDVLKGGNYTSLNYDNNNLFINITGLQPSGNYSLVGHSHLSSSITDLDSHVSGLLPVTNLVGGNNITISNSGSAYTIAVTGQLGLTSEQVNTRVKDLLVANNYVTLVPSGNYLLVGTSGLQPSGNYSLVGHSHTSSDITDFISVASGAAPVQTVAGRVGNIVLNKNDVGLNNVDNTSDSNKPVSIAQALADNAVQSAAAADATSKANNAQAYAVQRSNHTGTQLTATISDFNSSVSGLLPVKNVSGSGYINIVSTSGNYIVSVSGLQPSGNYSVVGHSHTSSNITDFISAASGAAPVQTVAGRAGNVTLTKSDVGLGNVDNTSDVNKPVSAAQAAADSAVQNAAASDATTKANNAQTYAVQRSNHTGTQLASTISDFNASASGAAPVQSVSGRIGNVVLTKNDVGLSNVDNTSDLNKPISSLTQTALDNKANLIHNHTASQITDFNSSVSGLLPVTTINNGNNIVINKSGTAFTILTSGLQPSGNYATLVNGLIPSAQLPSYVDDVLEYTNLVSMPNPGETGKIYTALDSNKIYRWSGSTYIEISASPGSTDNVPEGAVNKYYTDARASAAAPVQTVSGRAGNVTLTKSDVGLGNVDNTSDVNKPVSAAQAAADSAVQAYAVQRSNHTGTQLSSTISDFNNAVSGLLPITTLTSNSGIFISNNGSSYNISSTGLAYLSGSNFNSLSVTGIPVSVSGHKHSYIDVVDFGSGVQNSITTTLLPGPFISLYYDSIVDTLTIFSTGLQPSGNYSLVGHTHVVSDITNFASGVSGVVSGVYAPLSSPNFTGTPTVPTAASSTNTTQIASTAFVNTAVSNASGTLNTNINLKANLSGANFTGSITAPTGNFTTLQQNSISVSTVGHTHTSSQITDFISAASGAAPVQTVSGRAGNVTLTKSDVGLGNVDNTSDVNKPVSAAQDRKSTRLNSSHSSVSRMPSSA